MNTEDIKFIGRFIEENMDILCCPKCNGDMEFIKNVLKCKYCNQMFSFENNVPLLFYPNEWTEGKDVTESIKAFYEETPFPNYDDFDNVGSLIDKSKRGVFAKLLDEQIPFGTRIIECGCGTGQLSNFLSVANRIVIGTDICLNSLKLAQDFKEKNELERIFFIQMNLFRPAFKGESFDLVISTGVLHHTSNPFLGFKTIANLVKPGGYILIGLYHKYGRVFTNIRRVIFKMTNDRLRFLDTRLDDTKLNIARKKTWFKDQYKNPHESKHTIGEVLEWFKKTGFSFIKSIPKMKIGESFSENEKLFKRDEIRGKAERFLKEIGMIFSNAKDGGFFIMIGKKNK